MLTTTCLRHGPTSKGCASSCAVSIFAWPTLHKPSNGHGAAHCQKQRNNTSVAAATAQKLRQRKHHNRHSQPCCQPCKPTPQFVSAKACNRDNGNALASTGNEEKTMLIIEGIGHDTTAKAIWQKLVNDRRVGITFDLYYCGIAFFDKRFKQNYIVNF